MEMAFTLIKVKVSSPELSLISQAKSQGLINHDYVFNPGKSQVSFKTVNPTLLIGELERCLPKEIRSRIVMKDANVIAN